MKRYRVTFDLWADSDVQAIQTVQRLVGLASQDGSHNFDNFRFGVDNFETAAESAFAEGKDGSA